MTHTARGGGGSYRQRVSCFSCRHFYVTWDPAFPRGCRAMGFKGRQLPGEVVRRASGVACMLFAERVNMGRTGKLDRS